MNLDHLYILCTELQSITSTKEKQEFLIKNRCDDFDELLKFLLDPSVVTGLDKKKIKRGVINNEWYVHPHDLSQALSYIKSNNTGRDMDIATCCIFIEDNLSYKDFLESIFTKSLKLGVNIKLVQKAYGKDFIHVHEVQLGSGRDKLRLKPNEEFFITRKLNGVRCTYANGKLISRQGTVFKGLDHIASVLKEVEAYIGGGAWTFDGELINNNDGSLSDNDNFRLGTGIINSDSADKSNIKLVLFDVLPTKEFLEGESKANYKERREMLTGISYWLGQKSYPSVEVTPLLYHGTDPNKIEEWLAYADAHDYEGCMVNKNAPYQCKRTTNLIKIKSFKHSDLRIVDCLEGDGKYKGVLGAFVVDYKGNTVHVGSGFSDQQRIDYWGDRDNLIGKICQVKYKETSKDKNTGLESLQFPVFEMLRLEKDEVSYE